MDTASIKRKLLDFTLKKVETFLDENPSLVFYAFAYDCNAEYSDVSLCFNTEDNFKSILSQYQTWEWSESYQKREEIYKLKYNPGDWQHQCFANITIFTEEDLGEIVKTFPKKNAQHDWDKLTEELLWIFCECLLDFSKTEIYNKIPKTRDFIAFCIDHDDSFQDAIERMWKIKRNLKN